MGAVGTPCLIEVSRNESLRRVAQLGMGGQAAVP